jgi:ribonuclease HII
MIDFFEDCLENQLLDEYGAIIGVDEAGRGCLAGPVYAGAVFCDFEIATRLLKINELTDSKKLTEKKRGRVFDEIKNLQIPFAFASVDSGKIDKINILNAAKEAMVKSVEKLQNRTASLVVAVDGNQKINISAPQITVVKGDLRFKTIAAASVVAKVLRDKYMKELHYRYPEYDFLSHKGYGTKKHKEMIKRFGVIKEHRLSFKLS